MIDRHLDTPSPSPRRRRTSAASATSVSVNASRVDRQGSDDDLLDLVAREPHVPLLQRAASRLVDSSCEDNDDVGDELRAPLTAATARTDLPSTTLADDILSTALREYRGVQPTCVPPFSVLAMDGLEITSPRGVSFSPKMVRGSHNDCSDAVLANLQSLLSIRARPLFYIGSTRDLVFRWRDADFSHANAEDVCWHSMVVLYMTDNGKDCAMMEEELIALFDREQYPRGLCKNISKKALRVQKDLVATHFVYVCLTKI